MIKYAVSLAIYLFTSPTLSLNASKILANFSFFKPLYNRFKR